MTLFHNTIDINSAKFYKHSLGNELLNFESWNFFYCAPESDTKLLLNCTKSLNNAINLIVTFWIARKKKKETINHDVNLQIGFLMCIQSMTLRFDLEGNDDYILPQVIYMPVHTKCNYCEHNRDICL